MSDLDLERIKSWRAAVREHQAKPLPRGPGSHYTTSPEGELRCAECDRMCGGAYVHPCDCCEMPNRPDLYVAVDVDALVAEVERLRGHEERLREMCDRVDRLDEFDPDAFSLRTVDLRRVLDDQPVWRHWTS